VVGGAAVCAVGALLVSGLVMATSGASPGAAGGGAPSTTAATIATPTTEPGTAHLASATSMARALETARPSLVALSVTRPSGTTTVTGVSAEAGGVIVTTVAALSGATSLSAESPDGTRQTVEMVGQDPTSGLAVVRGTADLPVAGFDLGDPAPGTVEMAVAVTGVPVGGQRLPLAVYAGTVESAGTAPGTDAATTTFATTTVATPVGTGDAGCVLLDAQGQVAGILETARTAGDATVAEFLPAELVAGVTRQLVAGGSVDRGWLGVDASDATQAPGGAVLQTVDPSGAAARGGLAVGDTIVAVDGGAVHSVAELRTRLYAEPPGTTVPVTYLRNGVAGTTTVELAAGDTDDSATTRSP
jgi:S1-C subfamily serine protease